MQSPCLWPFWNSASFRQESLELPCHNDNLAHLCCKSKLRTVSGLVSHKARTAEERKLAEGCSTQSSSCADSQRKPGSGNMSYRAPAARCRRPVVYLRKEERTTSLKEEEPSLMTLFQTPPLWFLVQHFFFPWEYVITFITTDTALIMPPTVEGPPRMISLGPSQQSPNSSEHGASPVKKIYNLCAHLDL